MAVETLAPARPATTPDARRTLLPLALPAALVAVAVLGRVSADLNGRVASAELSFISLFAESLPFLLAGAAISALLTGRMGTRLLAAAAARPRLAAALAPLAGAALPLCDCGLLPLARRLRGRPVGSFLAGAPLTNPIVIVSTLLAFPGRPGIAAARVLCGLAMAMAVSALVAPPAVACATEHAHAEQARGWRSGITTELMRSGPALALGALAAGTLKAALPTSAFVSVSSQPLLGAAAMMALAFVMSICSQADAFVAAALPVGTLPRLTFLVLGPVFDLRLATLYRHEFGLRWVLKYGAVVVPMALIGATACVTLGLA